MAKKIVKKAVKKVAKKAVKKSVKKKTATKVDIKKIHDIVDAIAAKGGTGIIIVLDSKNNEGVSYMNEVNAPEVAATMMGAIDGHTDDVLHLMVRAQLMSRFGM